MTQQTGRRLPLDSEFSQDGLYQQIVLHAADACRGWAYTEVDGRLDVLLWPRDRGPVEIQEVPYRVTQRRIEVGIWRVTLCPEGQLPEGVDRSTRDAALQAQIAQSALGMPMAAADQIVQAGQFGMVIYR